MFWRKVFRVLIVPILLISAFVSLSSAVEGKILTVSGVTEPQAAEIIYVDVDAPGPHDGTSWNNAYITVQDALAAASSNTQIWVAEGIYYPDEGTGQTNDDGASTFTLINGVVLYGGFGGTESSLDERDWVSHITVLSGDIDHEINPDTTDINGVVTDPTLIAGNNAYHVTYSSGVTNTAIIDGFTITAGKAPGGELGLCCGGGMYNIANSSPTLANMTFSGNLADLNGGGMYNDQSSPTLTNVIFSNNLTTGFYGGGIYNDHSSPTLTHVTFSGNSAGDSGGGIFNGPGSNPTLSHVNFSDNWAVAGGGGMYNDQSNPTLTHVTFFGNWVTTGSGGHGGGMRNTQSSPTLTDVIFSDNSASGSGGGMNNGSSSNPTLTDVTFSNNTAGSGGGMSNSYSTPMLSYVTFSSNLATDNGSGGGITNEYSNPILSKVIFSSNTAGSGGGMYDYESTPELTNVIFSDNSASNGSDGHGGGICNYYSSPILRNVTFSNNLATGNGGGMYSAYQGNPIITNVILWNNSAVIGGDQISNIGSTTVISYTLIQGSGGSGAGWNTALGTDGGGNIDVNPLFVNDAIQDYHLQSKSPAIDSGEDTICPNNDLDNNPRPMGLRCDMGAYEYSGLYLRKLANIAYPSPGETITFTIEAVNSTTETVSGGLLFDDLPAGLNLVGPITLEPPPSGTVGLTPPNLVTNMEIAAGDQITVTFPVSVSLKLENGPEITNTASLTSDKFPIPVFGSTTIIVKHKVFLPCILKNFCPDFFDDFSNPNSGWYVGDDAYDRSEYINGEYRILTKKSGYFYLRGAPTCSRENYTVELDARWVGVPGNSYGILFGITGDFDAYYLFDVNTEYQMYRLLQRGANGFTTITGPTSSSVIKVGTLMNHLKATRIGEQITLEINGVVIGTWSDGEIYDLTYVGLVSSPYNDAPVSDARFDNFSVIRLPGSSRAWSPTRIPLSMREDGEFNGTPNKVRPDDWTR